MKVLLCRDVGFDCDHKIRAETEEKILNQAAEHARTEHNVEVTPEMASKVKSLIRDESE